MLFPIGFPLSSEFGPAPVTADQVAAPAASPAPPAKAALLVEAIFSGMLYSAWGCSSFQLWVSDATIGTSELSKFVGGTSALGNSLLDVTVDTSGKCG